MAFAFSRVRPHISIFHRPSVQVSNDALKLLQAAVSQPYPQGAKEPLDFNLEVIDSQPPTRDQIATIQSYLGGGGWSSFLSSSTNANSPAAIHKAASESLDKVKWPIVVNWDDGEASIGSVEGVSDMLKRLSEKRDQGGKKGWFGS